MTRKVKKLYNLTLVLIILLNVASGCYNDNESHQAWPDITETTKPWSRWWWHGSAVTKEGITSELKAYKAAGFGGLELTPIYGVLGAEEQNIEYLSENWVDMLIFTLEESGRIGLKIDMATGTGWPFGGPWITGTDASKYLAHKEFKVFRGQRLKEKIRYTEKPLLRAVDNAMLQIFLHSNRDFHSVQDKLKDPDFNFKFNHTKIQDVINPIEQNQNLQDLSLDQVRFEQNLPLITLMAYSGNNRIELTDRVMGDGVLDWDPPEGSWTLHALFEGQHGKMVERAAPGGEGMVIDHFSRRAIDHYLEKFTQAFQGKELNNLRAFFNDSYEVDDALGQANWTPDFLHTFYLKKDYALTDYLDVLYSPDTTELHQRVLSDVREVFSDLLLETFTTGWREWAHSQRKIIRNQAHGSPSNILDLYALSDIPETEGTDIIRAKFASSAGNLTGRQLISSESATWLGEHFESNFSDLKQAVDRFFISGVNHIFYHGTAYSPPDEEWPGRLFYAAIHANPRNSLWEDFPEFNQYVTRVQSILQKGNPDNDILLYFPAYDRFATPEKEMLSHFDAHGPELDEMPFKTVADELLMSGYTFDFISDKQIQNLEFRANKIWSGGNQYNTIVIPPTQFIPLKTFHKILKLISSGARVICIDHLPEDVPGFSKIEERKKNFKELKSSLKFQRQSSAVEIASYGEGKILIGKALDQLLKNSGVEREKMSDLGIDFTRRKIDGSIYYFLSNWTEKAINNWISLSGSGKSVVIMDPVNDRKGMANSRFNGDKTEVFIQLQRGGSLILKLLNTVPDGDEWFYYQKSNEAYKLENGWDISFIKGGPTMPADVKNSPLLLFSELNKEAQAFSGTVKYTKTFSEMDNNGPGYLLELGEVFESAEVRFNGHKIAVLFGPDYSVFIEKSLFIKDNKLEILVTNRMANRIASLDRQNILWKKFYNINFPPGKRENMGQFKIFDASHWEFSPSGIKGPVVITKVNKL